MRVSERNRSETVGESKDLRLGPFYESKFILDSFIFWVFPARFLRRLAANVNLLPRSCVCSCDLFGFDTVRFKTWSASFINIFTWSHDILMLKLWNKRTENIIQAPFLPSIPTPAKIFDVLYCNVYVQKVVYIMYVFGKKKTISKRCIAQIRWTVKNKKK